MAVYKMTLSDGSSQTVAASSESAAIAKAVKAVTKVKQLKR